MQANSLISVVCPFFNEEAAVPHFFEEIYAVIGQSAERFEIVCVNDGVWSPSAQQWFRDIGGSYRYRQELQVQREAIADALARGQRDLILPSIVNPPKSLTAPEMQLTADGNNYANQCFARYYGLNSVAFKPPAGKTK